MTGEMNKYDISKHGGWYSVRMELENICKKAGKKCHVEPFDQYQGPFADVFGWGKIWKIDNDKFYFDGREEFTGSKKDMVKFLKELDSVKV